MKYTEIDAINYQCEERVWMTKVFEILENNNLTLDERYAHEMELARIGSIIGAEELKERKLEVAKQEAREAEQYLREVKQSLGEEPEFEEEEPELEEVNPELEEAKQKLKEADKRLSEAAERHIRGVRKTEGVKEVESKFEQKISNVIANLLQENIFTDEKIADILSVSIEQVHQVEAELNIVQNSTLSLH